MIKVKCTRDEARTLQRNFFPYWIQYLKTMLATTKPLTPEHFSLIARKSVLEVIYQKITRKLQGFANNFTFTFPDHETAVLYLMLMNFPVDEKEIWMQMVRDKFTSAIHKQLAEPINAMGQI